jgi:hypothetical protein
VVEIKDVHAPVGQKIIKPVVVGKDKIRSGGFDDGGVRDAELHEHGLPRQLRSVGIVFAKSRNAPGEQFEAPDFGVSVELRQKIARLGEDVGSGDDLLETPEYAVEGVEVLRHEAIRCARKALDEASIIAAHVEKEEKVRVHENPAPAVAGCQFPDILLHAKTLRSRKFFKASIRHAFESSGGRVYFDPLIVAKFGIHRSIILSHRLRQTRYPRRPREPDRHKPLATRMFDLFEEEVVEFVLVVNPAYFLESSVDRLPKVYI